MKKLLGNFAFLAIIAIIMAKFSSIFTGISFPLSIIVSESMEPTLHKGDIVPWIPCSIENVKKGDIIVYRSASSWNEKKFIVHRVENIMIKNGEKFLITKGDANNYTDQSGPHVPEPPVNDEMLEGKLIMLGEKPIKLSYAGYPWLIATSFSKKLAMPITWRNPQEKTHFVIFTPFLLFFSIFLLLIVLWLPNGKNLKERLHDLIFGETRLPVSKILLYTILMFIPFLLFTSFFSFDHAFIEKKDTISIFNPSIVEVRVISFFEVEDTLHENIFDIKSGEEKVINLNNSVHGNFYIYSSPFWLFIPKSLMNFFYGLNPRLCIILSSILSAVLLSIITSLVIVLISFLWDESIRMIAYSSYLAINSKRFYMFNFSFFIKPCKKLRGWISSFISWNGEMNKRVYLLSLLYIPFAVFLMDGLSNLLMICIISSIFVSIVSCLAGIKFKNEIAFLSFFSSLFYSSIFVGGAMTYIMMFSIAKLIQFLAVTMLLSLFLFIIMFSIMMLASHLMTIFMERFDPAKLIEVRDI